MKVVAISAHPDDETIGCGGTLLKHKANGDSINWIIITNINEANGWPSKIVRRRQLEIELVKNKFGFEKTYKLDFPTTKLDEIPISNIINKITNIFNELRPEIIYVVNRSDIHTDHQVTFQAVMSCTKNFRYPFIRRILMYECLSETEFAPALNGNAFIPNVFVDISNFFEDKLSIFMIYQSEIMEDNLPRSKNAITTLANYRGSRIGVLHAETFQLIFEKL